MRTIANRWKGCHVLAVTCALLGGSVALPFLCAAVSSSCHSAVRPARRGGAWEKASAKRRAVRRPPPQPALQGALGSLTPLFLQARLGGLAARHCGAR